MISSQNLLTLSQNLIIVNENYNSMDSLSKIWSKIYNICNSKYGDNNVFSYEQNMHNSELWKKEQWAPEGSESKSTEPKLKVQSDLLCKK